MAKSFAKNTLGRDLYINYDHEADGSTLAAGWFRNVRAGKTENGYGLFAKAEWTPKAKKHIEDKEYQYFSMECQIEGMIAKWSDGEIAMDFKVKKSCLTGGALTNNPYFKTTNLSLSDDNENNMEDNMPNSAELNADFEQFKIDKGIELQKLNDKIGELQLSIGAKDTKITELSNEIQSIKKENKDAMIASFVNKLPEDAEKREAVKVKLEKLADKLESAEFSEMAELLIKENDQRIKIEQPKTEFKEAEKVELSADEITEKALNDLKLKMGGQ
jgi:phage I-like protein